MKLLTMETISQALETAQVRYLIVGGLAVAMHGYSRATHDLDIVLAMDTGNLSRAFKVFASLGYKPSAPVSVHEFTEKSVRQSWIRDKGMQVLNMVSDDHPETSIDIFVTEPFAFDEEFERAYVQEISPGVPLRLVSIDTLIEMKRVAGRQIDLVDIEELEKIKGALNE